MWTKEEILQREMDEIAVCLILSLHGDGVEKNMYKLCMYVCVCACAHT